MKHIIILSFLLSLFSCDPNKQERIIQANINNNRAVDFGRGGWRPNMTPVQQANYDWKQSEIESGEERLSQLKSR